MSNLTDENVIKQSAVQVVEDDAPKLKRIASNIHIELKRGNDLINQAALNANRIGELLCQTKKKVPHGYWRIWVKENCSLTERQAKRYMSFYRDWDKYVKKADNFKKFNLELILTVLDGKDKKADVVAINNKKVKAQPAESIKPIEKRAEPEPETVDQSRLVTEWQGKMEGNIVMLKRYTEEFFSFLDHKSPQTKKVVRNITERLTYTFVDYLKVVDSWGLLTDEVRNQLKAFLN